MFKIIDMITGKNESMAVVKKPAGKISKPKASPKKKVSKKKLMSDSNPEQSFWINHGSVVRNLSELRDALSLISKETFEYHVNKDKNDFALWISEVLGDKELAKKLAKVWSQKSYQKVVDSHIKENYKV